MTWSHKPRILIVSDSPVLHTGFAKVARNIGNYLYNTDKYEVKAIGWFHRPTEIIVPFEIYPTKTENVQIAEKDKYSKITFPEVVNNYKPDLVLAIGDDWMQDHIVMYNNRNFKVISYLPVDGIPARKEVGKIFKTVDKLVTYGRFGYETIIARHPHLKDKMCWIPHGIDTNVFKPLPRSQIKDFKNKVLGENNFVIGFVSRNQPRKMIPRLIKAFKLFISKCSVCQQCGEIFWELKIDTCPRCKNSNIIFFPGKDEVRLYLHMALVDFGWNIPELVDRFELKGRVAYPKGLEIGKGVDTTTLVKIYNIFDINTLPTGGEGFGYSVLEGLACGIPTIATNYSGHVDICENVAELIKVSEFITETGTSVERAVVDLYDYCMRFDKLYYDDKSLFLKKWGKYLDIEYPGYNKDKLITGIKAREILSKAGRERALRYDWRHINKQWEELIDDILQYEVSIKERKLAEVKMEEV